MAKRQLDICVISDVHLGTYGCHAKELNRYLKKVQPKILVLNGDIIDVWQFSKRYWPDTHMKVIQRIVKMISKGTKVYYLTGNHDELLRRFSDFELGNFHIVNKLVLEMDGKRMWIFHGDVFDITMQHSKWLAKLGGWGYDMLILFNRFVNFISEKILRKGKISLSKKVKNGVKQAIKFIDDFEKTAIDLAIENGYDYVICGHIHQPCIKNITNIEGSTTYLNSGDWVENLTALEYTGGEWKIFSYREEYENPKNPVTPDIEDIIDDEEELKKLPEIKHLYEDIIRHTGNG